MNIWLVTLDYYDTVNAVSGTLYFSSGVGFVTGRADSPPDTIFDPRIKQAARLRRDMFAAGTTQGRSRFAVGELILTNTDGELDGLLNYAFDGREIAEYYGPSTGTFPTDFETMLVGTMESADFSYDEVRIKLRDRQAELDLPLQTTKYAGSNTLPDGLEGVEDLKGKPKPYLLGDVFNVPLPCVNTSKLIYQISDNEAASVSDVRDRGISLLATENTWASRTSGVATALYGIHHAAGYWGAVGASGVVRYSSDADAATWSAASSPGFGAETVRCIIYEPVSGNWIAGGTNDSLRFTATNPTGTWGAASTSPFGAAETIQALAVDGLGNTVGTGSAGVICYSADGGDNWTAATHSLGAVSIVSVAYGNQRFIVITSTGATAYSTDSGVNWTNGGAVDSTNATGITFGHGHFVAVGNGYFSDSVNGLQWTKRWVTTLAGVTVHMGVTFGGPKRLFVAVGGDGSSDATVWTSPDVANWTKREASNSTTVIRAVAGNTTTTVFVGDGGTMRAMGAPSAYASAADLEDETLAPTPGTYKYYLSSSGSYIRLGSPPAGLITADVIQGAAASNRTAGQLFAAVMTKMGKGSAYSTSDVTTLDASRTDVCGFWSGTDEWRAADVLDRIAASAEAWWGPDKDGSYRIKLGPVTTGVPVLYVVEDDMLEPLRRIGTNDGASGLPVYKYKVRYRHNYAPQDSDLAFGVSDANRVLFSQQWREEIVTTSSVQTAYLLAREETVETLLQTQANAASAATRRAATYDSRQDRFEFVMQLNDETLAVDMGDTIHITHSRFGLSAGAKFAVITIEPDAERNRVLFGCWRVA